MRQSVICGVLLLALAAANSYSRSYYVQTRTTDTLSIDGSILHPYLRIQQAASLMAFGDTCKIGNGIYRESVTMSASGTASQPIVFLGESMDSVVIQGGDALSGWTQYSGNIYKTNYTPAAKDLFVNRQYMALARFPNIRYDKYAGINMLKPKTGTSPQPAGVDWTGSYLINKIPGVMAEWVNVIAQTNN